MYKLGKELFFILSPNEKRRFIFLQFFVVISAFTEIVGIASVAPFMAFVADTSLIQETKISSDLYAFFKFTSEYEFIFFAGLALIAILIITTAISAIVNWRLAIFGAETGTGLSNKLFKYYITEDWSFHSNQNSSELLNNIAIEANRVTDLIIMPLLTINSRIILVTSIAIGLFIFQPYLALFGVAFFSFFYFLIFKYISSELTQNSKNISETNEARFGLLSEGFGGIIDVILNNKSQLYQVNFNNEGNTLAKSKGRNQALANVPRYIIESAAFIIIVTLILFLIKTYDGDLSYILPIISVYALAGFKLLPSTQQLYAMLTTIRGNISAFENIKHDLKKSLLSVKNLNEKIPELDFNKDISLDNISFEYGKDSSTSFINNFNLRIAKGDCIGIVGPSGSGKSTIMSIFLGLLKPQMGSIQLDGIVISENNIHSWYKKVGYVPQDIFMTDASISENIAFGVPKDEIDKNKLDEVLKLAQLDDFVKSLPLGANTKVGERGVQISGGQKQRIGIARALYNNPDILLFDEATSALDSITEAAIMKSIFELNKDRTIIIIAHRINTVVECDLIYYLEDGKIIDHGTFESLIDSCDGFRKLTLEDSSDE